MRTPQLHNEICSTSTIVDPRSHSIAHRTLCNQSHDSSTAKAGSLASSYDMQHVGMHQFNHVIHCSVHCVIGLRRKQWDCSIQNALLPSLSKVWVCGTTTAAPRRHTRKGIGTTDHHTHTNGPRLLVQCVMTPDGNGT